MMWFDRVVVTSSNLNQCELFKLELQRLRNNPAGGQLGLSPQSEIFTVADPLGVRVGSGGATFHAISEAYLPGKSLLVLHSGGDSRRNPLCCVQGKGFASINFALGSETCPLERLLLQVSRLFPTKSGALVCCTDTLMTELEAATGEEQPSLCFTSQAVTGIGMYTPWDFGTRHGVFYPKGKGFGILQKANESELRSTLGCINDEDQVLLDSGLIHLGECVVDQVLQCMREDPNFRGLTNQGMDAGLLPARFELYTDFLQALGGMSSLPSMFADRFQSFSFQVMSCAKRCEFIHLGTTKEHLDFVLGGGGDQIPLDRVSRSFVNEESGNDKLDGVVLINSLVETNRGWIGRGSLLEHCELLGEFQVGQGAIVSQLITPKQHPGISISANTCVQFTRLDAELLRERFMATMTATAYCCYSVFGVLDGVKEIFPKGKYCNRFWTEWDPVVTACLWGENEAMDKSLWNAKLFPVLALEHSASELESALWLQTGQLPPPATFQLWKQSLRLSLSDLVWVCDVAQQFAWNRVELPRRILVSKLKHAIATRQPYPKLSPELATGLPSELDHMHFADESLNARTMSLMADLLCKERSSGNARHPDFAPALLLLSSSRALSNERLEAVRMLARLRDSPYWKLHALRVARHYDMASQLLTGRSLAVDANLPSPAPAKPCNPVPVGRWVHASAPCRIDLAGGWTDTPPISNELGGIVTNVAVNLVPNQHALGASSRRIPAKTFVLRYGRFDQSDAADALVLTNALSFADHADPTSPCALLKCVLLALFPLSSLFTLGFGLEVCVWSDLPAGSGLGGSSILAACALLACSKAVGLAQQSRSDICRLVLKVEQLLSTGGGWQDQVGAIYPGFKTTSSQAALPITVHVNELVPRSDFAAWFESRGVLVQTGPARLARDLLQVVIRRWHRRESEFCSAAQALKRNALDMTAYLVLGDSVGVAAQVNQYWWLKKQVSGALQAEPSLIGDLFRTVDGASQT
ncbi:hypothetical protein BASA81_010276 [Batrachochytrium salamandrivorans]|nr:hypothetical protein BASA81_010276 [Batrachochytrium salamandrivorans]